MREIKLEDERKQVGKEVLSRLKHKKNCDTSKTRVRNNIEKAIEQAKQLVIDGILVDDGTKVAIQTGEELKSYANMIRSNGIMSYDVETTGFCPYLDYIVGLCLYTPNENEIRAYIPINHTDINNNRLGGQLTEEEIIEELGDILKGDKVKIVTHTAKMEGKFTKVQLKTEIEQYYFDVWMGACLLNYDESHELKDLYDKYILKLPKEQIGGSSYADLFGKTVPFNYVPISIAKLYGADDAYKTYMLYEFQKQFIDLDHKREDYRGLANIMFNVEMPLVPIIVDMELKGVKIDTEEAKKLEDIFVTEINGVESRLDNFVLKHKEKVLGHPDLLRLMKLKEGEEIKVNYNSPPQISTLIYDVFGCKSVNKKKPRGTGKDEIAKLMQKYPKGKNFFSDLLQYKGLSKLLSTYVIKLPKEVNPITGALHGKFNSYGAGTGRFSSFDPNLQNIPSKEKRIRRIFIAREGFYLNCSDYSQIEPRILAILPQIYGIINEAGLMKRAYIEGKDLYSFLASVVFNKPYAECGDGTEERRAVKGVLLGIMYGRTPESIAEEFGKPKEWGHMIVNLFYKSFPEVKYVMEYVLAQAQEKGYITTLLGRKRRLPDIRLSKDDWRYQEAVRQVLNSIIQGTSAEITKLAMQYIGHDLRLKELGLYQLITVHDEIISEVPHENVIEASKIKKALMIKAGTDVLGTDMPISVDTDICEKWYGEKLNERVGLIV